MISFNHSITIDESKKAKYNFNPFLSMLIAYGLTFLGSISTFIPGVIYGLVLAITQSPTDTAAIGGTAEFAVFSLFARGMTIIVCILFCKLVFKKNLRSMGFSKTKIIPEYLKGLLAGFVMFSAVVIILILTNQISSLQFSNASAVIIIFFFLGYMVQGASEETLCRGYLLTSVSARNGILWGIMTNSVLFGLLHFFNDGFTVLPFINIVLVGIFFSLYFLRTDNIWGVCAIHSIWNFAQGNVYGISVSGGKISPSILVPSTFKTSIISGGAFGAEGGLAVTIVLVISLLLILFIPRRTSDTN